MQWNFRRLFILTTVPALSACGLSSEFVSKQISEDVQRSASCGTLSEAVTTTLTKALLEDTGLPSSENLKQELQKSLPASPAKESLVDAVVKAYELSVFKSQEVLSLKTNAELLEVVTGLEIGDRTTPEKAQLKSELESLYQAATSAAQAAGLDCAEQNPPSTSTPVADTPASGNPVVDEQDPLPSTPPTLPGSLKVSAPTQGALRVLGTAYQSCRSLRLPAMDSKTPATSGIVITGKHENGVGQKREVGNLKLVQQTHYYIREGIESPGGCFDVPAKPLIYDYGGKPYAGSDVSSPLDLFRDAGTGTKVLGIDCSGYIFSALAVSGLRVSAGKTLKASLVYGINARMYMEPTNNGLTCLAPVPSTPTAPLKDGDILASTGHIVMVTALGQDPFGLSRAKTLADCKSSLLTHSGFDFDVLHSAPIKSGVGINRIKAKDYLNESSSMKTALVEYAVAACKARFTGQSSTIKPTSARLVRHKGTPECRDKPVSLSRESCVRHCTDEAGLALNLQ